MNDTSSPANNCIIDCPSKQLKLICRDELPFHLSWAGLSLSMQVLLVCRPAIPLVLGRLMPQYAGAVGLQTCHSTCPGQAYASVCRCCWFADLPFHLSWAGLCLSMQVLLVCRPAIPLVLGRLMPQYAGAVGLQTCHSTCPGQAYASVCRCCWFADLPFHLSWAGLCLSMQVLLVCRPAIPLVLGRLKPQYAGAVGLQTCHSTCPGQAYASVCRCCWFADLSFHLSWAGLCLSMQVLLVCRPVQGRPDIPLVLGRLKPQCAGAVGLQLCSRTT